MPELRRLFYAMMAEAGADNFSIAKAQSALERGIKRDGGILLVATGKPGRLVGFILFELIAPWFSDAERITETCIFVEHGHRRSVGARELRKVAEWWRKESDKRKTDTAPVGANSLSAAQNGAAAATPKSVTAASSEQNTIVSNEVPSQNVGAAIALSEDQQSRQSTNGAPGEFAELERMGEQALRAWVARQLGKIGAVAVEPEVGRGSSVGLPSGGGGQI
jgi:hypothetical protein